MFRVITSLLLCVAAVQAWGEGFGSNRFGTSSFQTGFGGTQGGLRGIGGHSGSKFGQQPGFGLNGQQHGFGFTNQQTGLDLNGQSGFGFSRQQPGFGSRFGINSGSFGGLDQNKLGFGSGRFGVNAGLQTGFQGGFGQGLGSPLGSQSSFGGNQGFGFRNGFGSLQGSRGGFGSLQGNSQLGGFGGTTGRW